MHEKEEKKVYLMNLKVLHPSYRSGVFLCFNTDNNILEVYILVLVDISWNTTGAFSKQMTNFVRKKYRFSSIL